MESEKVMKRAENVMDRRERETKELGEWNVEIKNIAPNMFVIIFHGFIPNVYKNNKIDKEWMGKM